MHLKFTIFNSNSLIIWLFRVRDCSLFKYRFLKLLCCRTIFDEYKLTLRVWWYNKRLTTEFSLCSVVCLCTVFGFYIWVTAVIYTAVAYITLLARIFRLTVCGSSPGFFLCLLVDVSLCQLSYNGSYNISIIVAYFRFNISAFFGNVVCRSQDMPERDREALL